MFGKRRPHGLESNPQCSLPFHKGALLVPVLNKVNPVHVFASCFFKIHSHTFLPSAPSMPRSSKLSFLFRFAARTLYEFFFSPMLATCPAHHIVLDFFIAIISGPRRFETFRKNKKKITVRCCQPHAQTLS